MLALPIHFLLAVGAIAQTTTPTAAKIGYVVRWDSGAVWLDLTAADGAAPGRRFTVYTEGDELKHPVTGASLGRVENTLGEGVITDVADKFSMGKMETKNEIKPGARVRLGAAPTPAPAVSAPTISRTDSVVLRTPKSRGALLPFSATAMVVDDFAGAGKPQIALSDEKTIYLYEYPAATAAAKTTTELKATGVRIVSLESGDLDGNGRAELFVGVFNEPFQRFETLVYNLDGDSWKKSAELPWLVRAHQDPKGAKVIACQQIQDDKTFPFGAIFPLIYRDGRYEQGRPAINAKRVDWLYEFTFAQLDASEPALLYLTNVNTLRVQFAKGQWRSTQSYGQSPIRVRWRDRLLEFHPPFIASYGTGGFQTLYAARNLALLGGLANPFGLFSSGELIALSWNGVSFDPAWKAELGGATLGFALVKTAEGRSELAATVTGSSGKSSVWTFDP